MSEYVIRALDAVERRMRAPVSLRSTTAWGSAAAGARGSIRERAGPRAKWAARGRSVCREGKRTPPWSSTATPRWRGVNTALRRSFRASITGRNGRPASQGSRPHYRITCIFVDRDYRQKGVAAVAVRGAVDLIAKAGGGVVEGYPHDLRARRCGHSSSTAPRAASSRSSASVTSGQRVRRICVMRIDGFSCESAVTGSRRVTFAG